MAILGWLFLGVLAAWLGSRIVNAGRPGMVLEVVSVLVGLVCTVVGGYLFSVVGTGVPERFGLHATIATVAGTVVAGMAIAGAAIACVGIVLAIHRAIRPRRPTAAAAAPAPPAPLRHF